MHITHKGKDNMIKSIIDMLSKSKWISIDDKLPQCYQRVLCHRPDKFSVICKFVQGCGYHFTNAETGFVESDVTHWQPMPKTPDLHYD